MKKKLVAALLTMTMVAGSIAGCGSSAETTADTAAQADSDKSTSAETESSTQDVAVQETQEESTGYPIVTEPLTLKVMFGIRDQDNLVDFNEMPAFQRLEELTGIHIEWEIIKGADFETKVNLMFASGDYPDIIFADQLTLDDEEYGVTQGLVIPITDELTSQYMPNYTERIAAEDDDPTAALVASDGQKYSVGWLFSQNYNTEQHFFINQTWLDNLGLETPDTIDEVTEVLRAFKSEDANGNGDASDEIPFEMGLDTWACGLSYMLPLFGIPADSKRWIYIDDDAKVQFAPTQDEFRTAMETFHTWYSEGLIDAEVLSQDDNTLTTKLKEGNVGLFAAWRLTSMSYDQLAEDAVLYTPSGAKFSRYISQANDGAYLTVTNEHIAESLRWLDSLLETETMFSLYYGDQDDSGESGWMYNDEGKIVVNTSAMGSDQAKTNPDCNTLFFAPDNYISSVFEFSDNYKEKTAYSEEYESAGVLQKYSNKYLGLLPLTSDQLQNYQLLETDISNAVLESTAAFIRDGVTDDSWDAFVKIFDNMGVSDYVATYQTALDEYLAK